MLALPLLCLCLTALEPNPFADLPGHEYAVTLWCMGNHYVSDLERWQGMGGEYGERCREVLAEARPLRDWWGFVADATHPQYGAECRREYARQARCLHDWQAYGYPPALPFWRLARP